MLRPPVGTRIRLWAYGSALLRRLYEARVVAREGAQLVVSPPQQGGQVVLIPSGCEVGLAWAEEGAGVPVAVLHARVVERGRGEAGPTLRLARLRDPWRDAAALQARWPRRIAVVGAKGGVGRSMVAANLAAELARRGEAVVLVDADRDRADLEILLGGIQRPLDFSLRDALSVEGLRELRWGEVLPGLLLGPALAGARHLTLDAVWEEAWERLGERGFFVADLGSAGTAAELASLEGVWEVIVVATPDPHAVTDGYVLLRDLQGVAAVRRRWLVVNLCEAEAEAEQTREKMVFAAARFLGARLEPLGTLLREAAVRRAVHEQLPVTQVAPRSRAARELTRMAGRLVEVGPP